MEGLLSKLNVFVVLKGCFVVLEQFCIQKVYGFDEKNKRQKTKNGNGMGLEWDSNGSSTFDYQYFNSKCGNGMGLEWDSNGKTNN